MAVTKCTFVAVYFSLLMLNVSSLKVTIYYESLCPDCIRFVTDQLFPTYKLIGEGINVELIPFGKAQADNTTGKWKFSCQHGVKECYGNKIQSCVIALNPAPEGVDFVNCAMSSNDPSNDNYLKQCATNAEISWTNIQECMRSGQGDKLLALNGVRTKLVQPKIVFVPTIIFNDHFNQVLQNKALLEFLTVVCDLLDDEPEPCHDKYIRNSILLDLIP